MFSYLKNYFNPLIKRHPTRLQTIQELRAELTALINTNDPADFDDPVFGVLLIDPVLTSTGKIYDSHSIKTWMESREICPLTTHQLKKDELMKGEIIGNIIKQFSQDKSNMLKEVNSLNDLAKEWELRQKVTEYLHRIKKYQEIFENATNVLLTQSILNLKERLKLDMRSLEHLKFWSEKKSCCGLGLAKVKLKNKTFYLSQRTYSVMLAANQKYKSLREFREAIHKATHFPILKSKLWSGSLHTASLMEKTNFIESDFTGAPVTRANLLR